MATAAGSPGRPPRSRGLAVRRRVRGDIARVGQQANAFGQAVAARAEAMHQTVQHAESAVQSLGNEVMHDFTTGNYQGAADAIRNQVESAVNTARQQGQAFHDDLMRRLQRGSS